MKYIFLALLSGGLLAASWVTYGFAPLIFVAFVPLLWVQYRLCEQHLRVWLLSYLTFFVWNVCTSWWIWNATPVGGVFAVVVNSWLMSLVFFAFHLASRRFSAGIGLVFLVSLWLSFEKFHLWWDFSWPWLNLGNVFAEDIHLIQWYEYTGTFGGSLWVWLTNAVLFLGIRHFVQHKEKAVLTKSVAYFSLLVGLPIVFSLLLWGKEYKGDKIQVLVTQPNIDPYTEKYNTSNLSIARLLADMAKEKITPQTDFVLAPETVFADNNDFAQYRHWEELVPLQHFLTNSERTYFLGGVSMYEITGTSPTSSQSNFVESRGIWYNDYNSAFLLKNDAPLDFHHKSKLVVGVENLPFQQVLKPIFGNLMLDLGGTIALKTTQDSPSVFATHTGIRVAPIICYESIYGEYVAQYCQKEAGFLAIITNDAWWGNTPGHRQHLSYARLRAIETRKSVARSANTGISAFISPKGEITQHLPYGVQGVLLADLEHRTEQTFYVRHGDYIARVAFFISGVLALLALLRPRTSIFQG